MKRFFVSLIVIVTFFASSYASACEKCGKVAKTCVEVTCVIEKTVCATPTLATKNGTLVAYLEYNDTKWVLIEGSAEFEFELQPVKIKVTEWTNDSGTRRMLTSGFGCETRWLLVCSKKKTTITVVGSTSGNLE